MLYYFSSFGWTFILLYQPITNQFGWITLGGRLSWIFPDGLSRASCNRYSQVVLSNPCDTDRPSPDFPFNPHCLTRMLFDLLAYGILYTTPLLLLPLPVVYRATVLGTLLSLSGEFDTSLRKQWNMHQLLLSYP